MPEPREPAAAEIVRLQAEASYRRDRVALYRARIYGGKPASLQTLRELERESAAAEARLTHATRP